MTSNQLLIRARPRQWIRLAVATLSMATLAGLFAPAAQAVPSYARQTGADCVSCHIGGYGPQLTPYGIKFKLGGYTDTDGKDGKIPLSAMMVANWTQTAKNLPDADVVNHYKANNNLTMQETSLFLAGRFSDNIGSFVQATYDGLSRKSALDQMDVRCAQSLQLGGKDAILGLSLNSNPTLTDPFNTLGQWRFPYTDAGLAPGNNYSPKVESLAGGVVGLNAYGMLDNSYYGEIGIYNSLPNNWLNHLNTDDVGKFKGIGTYGRMAYFKDMKRDNFSVGLFGFDASIQPDRADLGVADRYRDLGVDASYQFLGNREHIFTFNTSYVREWQKLNYTHGTLGVSDNLDNTMDHFKVAASYHYNQTWGATLGLFDSRGSSDATLYGSSLNGRPNTSGYILQADWTPWGKESSWGAPWANTRLGVQYTGFNRYEGGSRYLDSDGNERRARDNNTLLLFLWMSI